MSKRDDYFRCKICKGLFSDNEAVLDPIKGLQCPNGCVEPYQQPPYESPLNDENSNYTKKM